MTELSNTDKIQLLSRALCDDDETGDNCYIRDVYDTWLTYVDYGDGDYGNSSSIWRRDYTIGANNTVTLGDVSEVTARTVYDPVTMSAQFSITDAPRVSSDGYVLRSGKLFEAGSWPDKNYAMTAGELAAAATDFTPCDVDLEHTPTVLSGKLGQVKSLEARGAELFGTVALPEWLDNLLEDGSRKISCTWDTQRKRLTGLALVRTPRISDAALYAAFGAFAGKRHNAQDIADMQTIHDLAAKQGAECSSAYADTNASKRSDPPLRSGKEKSPMTFMEELSAFFKGKGIEVENIQPETKPKEAPRSESTAGFSLAGVSFTENQLTQFKADSDTYRADVTDDLKAAHVRCFGKPMESAREATFANQSVLDLKATAEMWHEPADKAAGITRERGAKRIMQKTESVEQFAGNGGIVPGTPEDEAQTARAWAAKQNRRPAGKA